MDLFNDDKDDDEEPEQELESEDDDWIGPKLVPYHQVLKLTDEGKKSHKSGVGVKSAFVCD